MKTRVLIAIAAVFLLGFSSYVYAKYVAGFKVTEISGNEVTIQKGEASPVMLTVKKAEKFNVGDAVKYDSEKNRIIPNKPQKELEGC